MAHRTCTIKGCARLHYARGWCEMHYQRWRKWADPSGSAVRATAEERLWRYTDRRPDGCWLWTGALSDTGYGRLRVDGSAVYAHRFMYETVIGPIPAGLDVDHLCRVTSCVNPAHLEAVTHAENMRRGFTGSKTHCKHGHEFTEENTYVSPVGHRQCRKCRTRNMKDRAKRLNAGKSMRERKAS